MVWLWVCFSLTEVPVMPEVHLSAMRRPSVLSAPHPLLDPTTPLPPGSHQKSYCPQLPHPTFRTSLASSLQTPCLCQRCADVWREKPSS